MTQFFDAKVSLGPRAIVTLLLPPLSEFGLSDNSCKFFTSYGIQYCYDLLERPKEKIFAVLGCNISNIWPGRLASHIFEIRRIMWKLERYGFRIGMLESATMVWIQFADSLEERKQREMRQERKIELLAKSLRLGVGNSHPANPRSQVIYDGSVLPGQW